MKEERPSAASFFFGGRNGQKTNRGNPGTSKKWQEHGANFKRNRDTG
jgi:hypothetical protein